MKHFSIATSFLAFASSFGNKGTWAQQQHDEREDLAIPVDERRLRGEPVVICHKGNTMQVDKNAVPGHLKHGDTEGPCAGSDPSTSIQSVLSNFEATAQGAGLPTLDMSGAATISGFGAVVVAATFQDLASTPWNDILGNQMPLGLSWMDIPGVLSPGYYTFRAQGPPADGTNTIQLGVFDAQDNRVDTMQAEIFLGDPREDGRSVVAGEIVPLSFDSRDNSSGSLPLIDPGTTAVVGFRITIWWLCDNGAWICVTIRF